jgi:Ca2+-binding EF-hand superfamily protein
MVTEKSAVLKASMAALCLGIITSQTIAQKPEQEGNRERQSQFGRGNGPGNLMRSLPVMAALDTDGNAEISAAEIEGAVAALKKLDKNKDGKLTNDELRPRFGNTRSAPSRNDSTGRPPSKVTQPANPIPPVPKAVGGINPREILKLFGARGTDGVTERTLEGYRRVFGFTDTDKDGRHSKKEYIDGGRYLTRASRTGIFQASDSNRDEFVSEKEYVENRIITDEAKEIFSAMDSNNDNKLTAQEMTASKKLVGKKLVDEVFDAFDINGNGELNIPEYLRVWGRWARL